MTTHRSAQGVKGCATERGTERYSRRFAGARAQDFFRTLGDLLQVSSVGIGTYLGECDEETDRRYVAAIRAAIDSGINVLDTAINYRCQRSERCVGAAVSDAIASGAKRDELVVCTKGGYVPLEGNPPATRTEYERFLRSQYFDRGVMAPHDVIAGGHCMRAGFITDQIRRSRRNLRLDTIDVYYLHNPEQQLESVSRERFRALLEEAFIALEGEVAAGRIGAYGCATWNGLRVPPDTKGHLSLEEMTDVARAVAGDDHHLRVVQLPVNLAMTEAVRTPTQRLRGSLVPAVHAAAELGLAVIASAALMQGQLARGLPPKVRDAFPGLTTDAQRALAFVRSLPVTTALVGMRDAAHVGENVAAAAATGATAA